MRPFKFARAGVLALAVVLAPSALAQGAFDPYQQSPQPSPDPAQWPVGDSTQPPPAPDGTAPPPPPDGTTPAPPPDDLAAPPQEEDTLVTQPQPGLEASIDTPPPSLPPEALLDGHPRMGPFLAGPGSMTFIVHNSILGAVGGFGTQLLSNRFDFQRGREGMLIGTLVGAGIGFAVSTWWQFTHWMDQPVAAFSVVNAAYAGMLAAGMVDSLSNDLTALSWSAFISAELGGWLTAAIGGGEMRLADGLAMTSAGAWAAAYTALVLATLTYSGGTVPALKTWVDALLLAPGIGASAMAVALLQIRPTANQVLRADAFGFGVGAAVLVTSGFVVGFDNTTTYVLAALSSALALTAVSIFWEEAAEKVPAQDPVQALFGGGRGRKLAKKRPYNNPWW